MGLYSCASLAVSILLLGQAGAIASAPKRPDVPTTLALHKRATDELTTIRRLIENPSGLTIQRLAKQFRFDHAVESCAPTAVHQNYCLYSLQNQRSPVARILSLGIGKSVQSGLSGARIDWTPWLDHVCISARDLQPLLGEGDVTDVNVPLLLPGSDAKPPAIVSVLYRAIPQGVRGAQAEVTFKDRCVTQINFLF